MDQSNRVLFVLAPEVDIPMPNDIWEVGAISAPRDFLPFRSIEFVQLMMARNFLDEIVRGSLKVAGF
jgi:hypothetical protein